MQETSFNTNSTLRIDGDLPENKYLTKNDGSKNTSGNAKENRILRDGRITSEVSPSHQERTTSLPCTPFQNRKYSRKSHDNTDYQNHSTLQSVQDTAAIITSMQENKKQDQFQRNCEDRDDNAHDPKSSTSNFSSKVRKKNSVLTPEQYYREQRRSQITDKNNHVGQNLRKSQLDASPICRRVSKAILAVSTNPQNTGEALFHGVTYGQELIHLEAKKIYLFVADAQTQTDDITENLSKIEVKSPKLDKVPESCTIKDQEPVMKNKQQIISPIHSISEEIGELNGNIQDKSINKNDVLYSSQALPLNTSVQGISGAMSGINEADGLTNDKPLRNMEASYSSCDQAIPEGKR